MIFFRRSSGAMIWDEKITYETVKTKIEHSRPLPFHSEKNKIIGRKGLGFHH